MPCDTRCLDGRGSAGSRSSSLRRQRKSLPSRGRAFAQAFSALPLVAHAGSAVSSRHLALEEDRQILDVFLAKTLSPSEAQESEAMQYINERGAESVHISSEQMRRHAIMTPRFNERALLTKGPEWIPPRIHLLDNGAWDRGCIYGEHAMGYRYSLEYWWRAFLMGNPSLLVSNASQADYLYLPHCATSRFYHITAQEAKREELKAARRRQRAKLGGASNATLKGIRSWRLDEVLKYEGNLMRRPVERTEEEHLLHLLWNSWSRTAEFRDCLRREGCRFLICSVYGRHVWRRLAGALGDTAVFVTHAGMSRWLAAQGQRPRRRHFTEVDETAEPPPAGSCRASCAEHCVLEPPPVLPQDVVLPWTVAFSWTARSANFSARSILAFFSGTDNSCSRKGLLEVFQGSFRGQLQQLRATLVEESASSSTRSPTPAAEKPILVFPSTYRLLQSEWSEFAYRSRLCLVPDGDSPNTGRLVEALMHGCVPIVISDRLQPPFHEYVDWSQFAFFLHEDAIPQLPQFLRKLAGPWGAKMISAKQQALASAAHVLDFNGDLLTSLISISLGDTLRRRPHRKARRLQAAAE